MCQCRPQPHLRLESGLMTASTHPYPLALALLSQRAPNRWTPAPRTPRHRELGCAGSAPSSLLATCSFQEASKGPGLYRGQTSVNSPSLDLITLLERGWKGTGIRREPAPHLCPLCSCRVVPKPTTSLPRPATENKSALSHQTLSGAWSPLPCSSTHSHDAPPLRHFHRSRSSPARRGQVCPRRPRTGLQALFLGCECPQQKEPRLKL